MRILLVQTSFLGDTILSTPLIAALKQLHAGAELWMMTTVLANQLIRHDPLLAGTIIFDKRSSRSGFSGLWQTARELRELKFDRAYSVHRSARTSLLLFLAGIPERIGFKEASLSFLYTKSVHRQKREHDVLRNLSLLSAESSLSELAHELRLYPPEIEQVGPETSELVAGAGRYLVVVPGSAWRTKMWHWEHYREVVKQLCAVGEKVVLLGSPDEVEVAEQVGEGLAVVNLAGRISLAESMLIVKNAALVICNDSMALHMASAFKVPTVAIFCSTSPSFGFGPWRNNALVVEMQNLPCKPCGRHGFHSCPLSTESCMRELEAEEVLAAVRELSSSPAASMV